MDGGEKTGALGTVGAHRGDRARPGTTSGSRWVLHTIGPGAALRCVMRARCWSPPSTRGTRCVSRRRELLVLALQEPALASRPQRSERGRSRFRGGYYHGRACE